MQSTATIHPLCRYYLFSLHVLLIHFTGIWSDWSDQEVFFVDVNTWLVRLVQFAKQTETRVYVSFDDTS